MSPADWVRALDTLDLALGILAAVLAIVGLYTRKALMQKLRSGLFYVQLTLRSWRYK